MKWPAFLLLASVVISPVYLEAYDSVLSGYVESGRSSTAEDYEEEDNDEDYVYQNYHLRLAQELSDRRRYNIGSFIHSKNYKTSDTLDNRSRLFKSSFSYEIEKSKEESLDLDFKFNYKQKRFDSVPASEYDRITVLPELTFKKNHRYVLSAALGVDDFDYLERSQKDLTRILVKLAGKRFFWDEKLAVHSAYRIETAKQKKINRERTKHDINQGLDYIFSLPWIYKLSLKAGWGQRDTKEDDQRDQDFDYDYWHYAAKTEHRLNPKIKAEVKPGYFKKDYIVLHKFEKLRMP